jgi:hypothetical protein
MTLEAVLSGLWAALNSPLGIALVAALALWGLNRLYAKKPAWKKYEGHIIAAVKAAEKVIPDGSANTSVRRFDEALKYVLAIYEQVEKGAPDQATLLALREGINLKHAELEAAGQL